MSVESRGGSAHRGRAGAEAPTGGPAAAAGAGGSRDRTADGLSTLLAPAVAEAGLDLEAVEVRPAGRRRLVKIVVDGDGGVSLDDVAEVSRVASELLDASDVMGTAPYVLEVTSPGVDRPLTEARHWRRAAGRLVVVPLTGEETGQIEGRVVSADDDAVVIDVTPAKGKAVKGRPVKPVRREFALADLGPGRVQVEFRSEADTADTADTADDSAAADGGRTADADGADGEETGGHGGGEPVDDPAGEAEETRSPAEPE
ncbi:ribosome maturation factor RimP [Actinomadura logoneensis]|uniref:Ribosome maturation factor RimP n=1 Tax=Actinomadura logoneensis TaxID=2293572 RepID=A0A372JST0_9ACTN|nr:ribosome maturation factor RimP [Actinomadura logoneensis]